jgi:hypothetical protein
MRGAVARAVRTDLGKDKDVSDRAERVWKDSDALEGIACSALLLLQDEECESGRLQRAWSETQQTDLSFVLILTYTSSVSLRRVNARMVLSTSSSLAGSFL